jgi:hypothetical protein
MFSVRADREFDLGDDLRGRLIFGLGLLQLELGRIAVGDARLAIRSESVRAASVPRATSSRASSPSSTM